MTTFALDLAAALTLLIGLVHSYLGERFVLRRLFRSGTLDTLYRDPVFIRRTLRFAWHLTSVAWWGFAALLVLLAHDALDPASVALVTSVTFLIHGTVTLCALRGRHLAWIVFMVVGTLALLAT